MRALRVLGIAENGGHLVCADTDDPEGTQETFALPLDERLRAAVRGDLSRFGQLEIEMQPQLRPKEIQSRIRAGASVAQVAAAAGCTPERIERYAYPVLMERTTIADRARRVRPLAGAAIGSAGAARADRTLQEIVTATLADRGQQQDISWDAFRDERGWTVTASWRAGRSQNRAEWAYHGGPDGGGVTARNQAAADLVEPAPRALRTVGDGSRRGDTSSSETPRAGAPEVRRTSGDEARRTTHDGDRGASGDENRRGAAATGPQARSSAANEPTRRAIASSAGAPRGGATPHSPAPEQATPADDSIVERTVTDDRAGALLSGTDDHRDRATGTTDAAPGGVASDSAAGGSRTARRGHRPPMPSWEDVLLGTRASGR